MRNGTLPPYVLQTALPSVDIKQWVAHCPQRPFPNLVTSRPATAGMLACSAY